MLRGKNKLVNGLDDIAVTLQYEDEIAAYENAKAFQ
jgi:3-isopropylmalate/(R)-2-methylmalate dehydratase small subunit